MIMIIIIVTIIIIMIIIILLLSTTTTTTTTTITPKLHPLLRRQQCYSNAFTNSSSGSISSSVPEVLQAKSHHEPAAVK